MSGDNMTEAKPFFAPADNVAFVNKEAVKHTPWQQPQQRRQTFVAW